jgi:cytochrome P450
LLLRSDPLALLERHAESGEKIAPIPLPESSRVHLVNAPELVAQILNDQSGALRKYLPTGVGAVFANGILNSSGDLHRTTRDAAQPLFHRGQIMGWDAVIAQVLDAFVEQLHLSIGTERDMHRAFQELMLVLVGRIFFALDLGAVAAELTDCLDQMQRLFRQIDASPRAAERFQLHSDRFDTLLRDAVHNQPDARRKGPLFCAFDTTGRMTAHQVEDELRNFVMAGSLTTSVTLAAMCATLAADSTLQHAIRRDASGESVRHLLEETLRFYPPVWLMLREAITPFTLAGRIFPASTIFLICPWTLHRSRAHFSNPEQLRPDRWKTIGDLPRGLFIPFSLGTRNCAGERFGRHVAERTIRKIVQTFALAPPAVHGEAEWMPHFTLWPNRGVWVILREVPASHE